MSQNAWISSNEVQEAMKLRWLHFIIQTLLCGRSPRKRIFKALCGAMQPVGLVTRLDAFFSKVTCALEVEQGESQQRKPLKDSEI